MRALGYSIEHRVVATSDFLPQRRQRVWFVCTRLDGNVKNVFQVVHACKSLGSPDLRSILQASRDRPTEQLLPRKVSRRKTRKWEMRTVQFVQSNKITMDQLHRACQMLRDCAAFHELSSREQRLLEARFALCIKQRLDPVMLCHILPSKFPSYCPSQMSTHTSHTQRFLEPCV